MDLNPETVGAGEDELARVWLRRCLVAMETGVDELRAGGARRADVAKELARVVLVARIDLEERGVAI